MLTIGPGPDPYFAYKLHHVDRARTAWILSEEFGLYEALRDGPATIAEVGRRTGLQERPAAVLLAASASLGILGVEDDRYHIYEVMREMVLEGGRARTVPRAPDPEDWWYRIMKQALRTNAQVPEALPDWLTNPKGDEDTTALCPGPPRLARPVGPRPGRGLRLQSLPHRGGPGRRHRRGAGGSDRALPAPAGHRRRPALQPEDR